MSDWFNTLAAGNELPEHVASELEERGFAYTEAVTSATGDDIRVGSTATKVIDFVKRGAAFGGTLP